MAVLDDSQAGRAAPRRALPGWDGPASNDVAMISFTIMIIVIIRERFWAHAACSVAINNIYIYI